MQRCQWIVNDDGTQSRLDERGIENLRAIQNEWCMLGQRVLLICKKVESVSALTARGFRSSPAGFETYLKSLDDLCVLGMVGIIDKPREGIENIIRMCRQAGVRIFMVTVSIKNTIN
jgi:sodium/potassium-transporting ATPase subunit alpha